MDGNKKSVDSLRDRCYASYVSTHAGGGSPSASRLVYGRDILPNLAPADRRPRVLDIGCGKGELVELLRRDGFEALGIDISPEQVNIAHSRGLNQVECGDFHRYLESGPESWDAVIATDLLEHLDRDEVMRTFDEVFSALNPGGVFIARVPNAVSPVGGNVMYSDVTHETWFTHRSVAQLAAVAGFASVRAFGCPPVAHGIKSGVRVIAWKIISGLLKFALAAETGQLRGHVITQNLTFVARKK